MNKKIIKIIVLILVLLGLGLLVYSNNTKIPTVKTLTYQSELGFSFEYPDYLDVVADFDGGTYRYLIIPTEVKNNENLPITSIIISLGESNTDMTPEQWLLGPNSGYDQSIPYYKLEIGGQEAVSTDNGMWIVVNTPDNKYRLSIADYHEEGAKILSSEMEILIKSLNFK
jgi:hypothetical protein